MSAPVPTSRSMRRQLFRSHLLVMVVALAVLAVVLGIVALVGEATSLRLERRDGGPGALLLGLLAAAIASALVSWRVTNRLARPLEDIGAATRQLAVGRYGVRAPAAGIVELDDLAEDVNQLAHELDTTEQRRLRLIGDVAHELRNPLSTIQGTMEALLDGVVSADDETFARVGREAARLRRLADDLSSLSGAGELGAVARESLELTPILCDVVAQLEPQASAKDLELRLKDAKVPAIAGDKDRLTQVFMNVVGNAVQYTDVGAICVRAYEKGGAVIVEVSDTGRGLAAVDRSRIFERFHRVDQHLTEGTGVGLAIAKLIVEAHGGRIAAVSEGLGLGTTVRIEVPVVES